MLYSLLHHLHFRLSPTLIPALLTLILLPFDSELSEAWSYENHLLEKLQMVVLLFNIGLCLTATKDKGFSSRSYSPS